MTADLVIVGGGPAGLAAAIAGCLRGLTATVLDGRRPPLDKACGEGLMPEAVAQLTAWGVPRPAGAPFHGIRYIDGDTVAEARFPAAVGDGLGVRRTALHAALAARAEELGAELRWGERVEGLETDGVRTVDGPVRGRFVVGADGLHSRVRAWAGLARASRRRPRFGVRRHYAAAPWTDCVEVHWSERREAYVTPVGPGEIGVALLWSGARGRFDELLAPFDALRSRLAGVPAVSRDRGAGPFDQRPRAVARGRVALVGDAAGYRDAITGEGLALAFGQAEALAAAVAGDSLAPYRRACRRLAGLPNALIAGLLWAERRPAVRRALVGALAAEPELFTRLLEIHCRVRPPRRLGLRHAWRLARIVTLRR